ncbi:MAG TPA: T9SS type A sorting domain-containing protein [bacterium]|jgi:hypothetical protein
MRTLALIFGLALCAALAFGTVDLAHFEAIPGSGQVRFQWGTTTETNNYFFEIWRNDTSQVQITGHGTTTQPWEYSWTDLHAVNETRYRYTLKTGSTSGRDSIASVIVIPPHWVALGNFLTHGGPRLAQLNWVALSEINNVRFEIFRNGTWVASVTGHSSNVPHNYAWTDTLVNHGATYEYSLWAVNVDAARDSLATSTITLGADELRAPLPQSAKLSAYPNPFNPATTLSFTLTAPQRLTVTVYDLNGRERQTLARDLFATGEHRLTFDASALPTGVYVARITGEQFNASQKLLLLK